MITIEKISDSTLKIVFLYGYIILMPLMKLPKVEFDGFWGIMSGKMEYADFFFAIFAILLFRVCLQWFKIQENAKLRNILIAIGLSWLLSMLFSMHKYVSAIDTAGLFMLMALYVLIIAVTDSYERFLLLNKVNFFAASIVSTIGLTIFFVYSFYPLPFLNEFLSLKYEENAAVIINRISSTLKTPEMLITYLNVALVSGFIVYFHERKKNIIFLLGSITVTACLAFSRSLAVFFITLSLILISLNVRQSVCRILTRLFGLSVILFLFITIVLSLYRVYSFDTSKGDLGQIIRYGHENRYYMHRAALRIFAEHPFVGVGPGSYTFEARNYIGSDAIYNKDVDILNTLYNGFTDPHNLYLGLLAENGISGTVFVILLLVYLFLENKKAIQRKQTDAELVNMHHALQAGLIGMVITGLFVDILSMRHFWVLMSMVYSSIKISKKD